MIYSSARHRNRKWNQSFVQELALCHSMEHLAGHALGKGFPVDSRIYWGLVGNMEICCMEVI